MHYTRPRYYTLGTSWIYRPRLSSPVFRVALRIILAPPPYAHRQGKPLTLPKGMSDVTDLLTKGLTNQAAYALQCVIGAWMTWVLTCKLLPC